MGISDSQATNRSLAYVVSDNDVCRAICIPPMYIKNFNQKHFLSNKFKYFRILFSCKNYLESRRDIQDHLYLVFLQQLVLFFFRLKRKSKPARLTTIFCDACGWAHTCKCFATVLAKKIFAKKIQSPFQLLDKKITPQSGE